VIDGLIYLLENHLSHPLLKGSSGTLCFLNCSQVLLPKLTVLLHDNTAGVRSKFLDLLATVKTMKLIRFYEIAPVDQLLQRLSMDPPQIGSKVTALLLNSYFPVDKALSTQVFLTILYH
jgi:condensin-2 complex subunit G2